MTEPVPNRSLPKKFKLSLDSWAVIVAFLAALLIRAGVIAHVPW
jgi:hypothetical protein